MVEDIPVFARSLAEGLCATIQKLIIAALHKFIHVLTFIELYIKKSQFVTKFKNEINFKTERCSFFVSNAQCLQYSLYYQTKTP